MVVAVALAQRKPTTSENKRKCSILGLVGLLISGGGQRKPTMPENKYEHSMLRVVDC